MVTSTLRKIRNEWGDLLPVGAVILSGLVFALIAFLLVREYFFTRDHARFQRDTAMLSTSIKDSMYRHVNSLTAIHAFVSTSHTVDRWEFSNFAHQVLPQNSGFSAVLWLPEVERSRRKVFEAQLRRDGLYGVGLREARKNETLVEAAERARYVPVAYVEPFVGNAGLIGVDLAQNPTYASLFEAARLSGNVVSSGVLAHTLGGARSPLVLLTFPMARAGARASQVNAARTDVDGYVVGILELERLIKPVLAAQDEVEAAILSSPKEARAWSASAEFHQLMPFSVAGRRYFLATWSAQKADVMTRLFIPAGAALLELTLTALLAQTMLATALRKREVERAVILRTAELSEANRALSGEIEQRRRAEAALTIARDRAESANRAKSAFLAVMSHELRTPLNAVIGFSGILIGDPGKLDERARDYMEEINGSGTLLLNLINDILEITQIETGEIGGDEPVYLCDVAAAVMEKMQLQAARAGVRLENAVSDGHPPVRGDAKRLTKALLNLVANAVKFTKKGGSTTISTRLLDGGLVLEVADTGVGLPPGTEARILELFSQGDDSLARPHEGVGLGLTLVRRIADYHEAVLSIATRPGDGTRVSMHFPAKRIFRMAVVA